MQIDTADLADPRRNAAFATVAMAISLFVFAYSTRFGKPPIVMFYALWLPVLALPATRLWSRLHRPLVLMVLPALALASVMWSDRPDVTLRAALQYASTVVLGLAAARVMGMASFARGLMIGGAVVLAYSHMIGGYAYDVVDGSYAFAGAFSSKNQLGLFASLTLLGSLGVILLVDRPALAALPALAVAGFAGWTILLTESATAMITVALAVMAMGAAVVLMRFDTPIRIAAVAALAVLIAVAGGLAFQGGALDTMLGVFGKDSTLTGRTYLWSRGIEIGQNAAPYGLGYNAFWVVGRGVAEELWLEFHIEAFTGFHFHNTLIEAYAALGNAGLILLGAWILGLPVMALWCLLGGGPVTRESRGAGGLCLGLAVLFAIRAFVEIDFFSPYTAGSFIVPYLLLSMADRVGDAGRVRRGIARIAAAQHRGEPFRPDPSFHPVAAVIPKPAVP